MTMFKKIFLNFTAAAFLCFLTQVSAGNSSAFFGPVPVGEKSLQDHFLNFLSRAKESIDACFFEIKSPEVIQAFIQAHQRGIKVRIQIDSNYYYSKNPDTLEVDYQHINPTIIPLIEAGIEVKEDEKRAGLMHNKFCILDNFWVWTGSYNLTIRGWERNENNAAEFASKKLAQIYKREFEEMYVDRRFGITSPSTVDKQSIVVGGKQIEVYFAPEDNPLLHIYEHLEQAQEEIYFMQFAMTANEIGDLLVKKHQSGVKVKGIFDKLLYRSTGPYAEFAKLTGNGIPVVVYDSELMGKLHHKVFIIDPKGSHPKVIFGSLNASANGNGTNDENVMMVEDKELTNQYFEKFRDLFGKTSRVVATFKQLKPIQANTVLDRLSLIISSNGVSVTDLNIQFPARWEKEQPDLDLKIYRFRNGKTVNTTKQEDFQITDRNLFINSVNLHHTGEEGLILIRMMNVATPTIPGLYNLYIQAKSKNQPYYPLRVQPVLEVVDENSESQHDGEPFQILTEISDEKYNLLNQALGRCLENYQCETFLSYGFMTRAKQMLKHTILLKGSSQAQTALDELEYLERNVLPEMRPAGPQELGTEFTDSSDVEALN